MKGRSTLSAAQFSSQPAAEQYMYQYSGSAQVITDPDGPKKDGFGSGTLHIIFNNLRCAWVQHLPLVQKLGKTKSLVTLDSNGTRKDYNRM
jgi:hypothetical protein